MEIDADQPAGKMLDGRILRRLAVYVLPYRKQLAATLLVLVAAGLVETAGPFLTRIAIDRYIAKPAAFAHPWLPDDTWRGLTLISLFYVSALFLRMALEWLRVMLMNWTGQKAMFALRRELIAKLHTLDIAYFDRNPTGRLVTRVTSDVDALNDLFSSGLVAILGDLFVLVWLLVILFSLSVPLTLVLLTVAPLVYWAAMRFRSQAAASYRQQRGAMARINAFLSEHLAGMTVLQLFNREQAAQDSFQEINRIYRDAYKDSVHSYGWFYPAIEFCNTLALAGLLAYSGWAIPSGGLSLGLVVAFFQYAYRLFRPIQDLSEKYNILQASMAAGERVFGLLDQQPALQPPANPLPLPEDNTITFERVWFAYNTPEGSEPQWVLRDVNFTISPGEAIAIVGHTGAGKTTITSLLLRFYDVQKGRILLGGIDIRQFAPQALRSRFAIVLQDPYLFTGTVRDNITLGTAGISDAAIWQAAEELNLAAFLRRLPAQLDEPVLERGSNLSTGQKQLLSFARALVHQPPILILDEATSSVETETEHKIREAQAKLQRGRTSISIAHRLSTIRNANRIFAFHKGQLLEQGTHEELLRSQGLYFRLFQLQFGLDPSRDETAIPLSLESPGTS